MRNRFVQLVLSLGSCAALFACAPFAAADDVGLDGGRIFAGQCARCHGPNGEGTPKHKSPLVGKLSVDELSDAIFQTMPEDKPGTISAEESAAVAKFIHDAFYSEIARARNQPARIALSRLTVKQYRQTVADLIGSFGRRAEWTEKRGLHGEYFDERNPGNKDHRRADRVDSQVDFDFGTQAPITAIADPRTFSARWTGSAFAPETGEYEFTIRTEHAARLWVNNLRTPLIDAWVKSGSETEYKASVFLVGGRPYPIRFEFTKAKQGVEDKKVVGKIKPTKRPPAPASVALLWQRPHGVVEAIPERQLSPDSTAESFVSTTPFPPDDRSLGWERGTEISEAWDEATTAAAIEAAGYISSRLNELARTAEGAVDRESKLRTFCTKFAERAFRHPLDAELQQTYVDRHFHDAKDLDAATHRVVLLILKSPRFLYRELANNNSDNNKNDDNDSFNTAARLSFALWNSLPDEKLLAAARADKLKTPDQLRQQATRMLADFRAQAKLHDFLLTWLRLDSDADLMKDTERYPNFDAATIADLRTSLDLSLDEILRSPRTDFRDLLLSNDLYLNGGLAETYAAGPRSSARFEKLRLDDGKRAGVLTHPYVMARYSHRSETSPIHRGVFLARGVLGQSLRPPPEAFTPLAPELHPEMTTRERVTLQTESATCMGCHHIINPLGFSLEHFDAIGRFRETDRDKAIDDVATYEPGDGPAVTVHGARELATYLAGSSDCHTAFAEQLFHHLVQQPAQAFGQQTIDQLVQSFASHDFNIRDLAVDVVVATAPVGRETESVQKTEVADADRIRHSREGGKP